MHLHTFIFKIHWSVFSRCIEDGILMISRICVMQTMLVVANKSVISCQVLSIWLYCFSILCCAQLNRSKLAYFLVTYGIGCYTYSKMHLRLLYYGTSSFRDAVLLLFLAKCVYMFLFHYINVVDILVCDLNVDMVTKCR